MCNHDKHSRVLHTLFTRCHRLHQTWDMLILNCTDRKWRWLFLITVQPSKELPLFCFGSGKCLSDTVLVGALHIILTSNPWDFIFPFYRSQRQGEAQIFAQDPTCDRSRISNWICLTQEVYSTNLWVVWYLQTLKPLKKKNHIWTTIPEVFMVFLFLSWSQANLVLNFGINCEVSIKRFNIYFFICLNNTTFIRIDSYKAPNRG